MIEKHVERILGPPENSRGVQNVFESLILIFLEFQGYFESFE